jgi:hypothetical protein
MALSKFTRLFFFVYPNRRYTKQEKDLLWRFAGYFKVNPFPSGFQTGRMNISSVSSDGRKLNYAIEGDDQNRFTNRIRSGC